MVDGNLKTKTSLLKGLLLFVNMLFRWATQTNPQKTLKCFVIKMTLSFSRICYAKRSKANSLRVKNRWVVGKNKDVFQAELFAESCIGNISGYLFHIKDIGTKKLIESRIKRMKELLQ